VLSRSCVAFFALMETSLTGPLTGVGGKKGAFASL
jgi:hypothetical protein